MKRIPPVLMWVFAAALGVAVTVHDDVVLTLAALAALVVLAALVRPDRLLLLAAVMVPFRVLEDLIPIARGGVTFADAFLIAFVVSSLSRKRAVDARRISALAVAAVAALVLIGAASMLYGGYWALGLRKVARIVTVGLALLGALRSLRHEDAEKAGTAFVLASAASGAVGLTLTAWLAALPGGGTRLWGGLEDPNHMSLVLAVATVIGIAWRPKRVPSGLWLGALLVMMTAQVVSLSRGGAVALGAGLAALVAFAAFARLSGRQMSAFTRSGTVLISAAVVAALATAYIPASVTGSAVLRYQGILDLQTDPTGSLRLRIWEAGFKMLARSPLLGVGPGAFGMALVASGAFSSPWEAHSSLVEIAVETGYLGVGAVLIALVAGTALGVRAYAAIVRDPEVSVERVSLAAGALASAGCVVAGGLSLSNVLYQPLFALVIIIAIASLGRQEPQP